MSRNNISDRDRRRAARLAALICAALLGACTASPGARLDQTCAGTGAAPVTVAQLFFGRDVPGAGEVSEAEWADFVAAEVTPRFPDGFTVLDARGQYLDAATRQVGREATKVLLVAAPQGQGALERIREIRQAYAGRFGQAAVGLVLSEACGAF